MRANSRAVIVITLAIAALGGCGPGLITNTGVNPEAIAEIEDEIARLRGRPFVPAVRVEVVDVEAMRAALTRLRESPESLRILHLWAVVDRAFGEPDVTDPHVRARRLPSDTTFGVYSPDDDALFLSRARLEPSRFLWWRALGDHERALAELVITHELVHAWQHRHLPALFEPTDDLDRWTAQRALREGDAEVTTLALTQHALDDRALDTYLRLRREMSAGAGQHPDTNHDWQLRYERATRFVYAVVRGRGWSGLNAVVADPRLRTADILAAAVPSGDVEPPTPIGSDLPCPTGWSLATDTTLGAYTIAELLPIDSGQTDRIGIDGWRGDRFQVCQRDGGDDFAWRWVTRWDTADAAAVFFTAARAHLIRRHPAAVADSTRDRLRLSPARWIERRGVMVTVADSSVADVTLGSP